MIASHSRDSSRGARTRKHGKRGFSLLELVAAMAIFATFMTSVVVAIQSARAPQFEASERYELLEVMADLVDSEAADPQSSLFTNGSLTPLLACPGSTSTTCLAIGSTSYELQWAVQERPDSARQQMMLSSKVVYFRCRY